MHPTIERLRRGLIVSCMATDDEPLHGPMFMAAMALAAEQGGAVGIKARDRQDVALVSRLVRIPVMGMQVVIDPLGKRWVTPTFEAAKAIVDAGAEIVAIQGLASRTFGDPAPVLIGRVHDELGKPLMVDVSSVEEARAAEAAGADMVRPVYKSPSPDFGLLEMVIAAVSCPVVGEGGYWTPEEAVRALDLGVHCLVVGTAITRPGQITKHWVEAIGRGRVLR
ncbi:MAG: N-acetylmannosamine-6-phosphate 2-epimerase [Bacillota bacterium]